MGQNESSPDGTAISIEKQTDDAFDVVHVSDDVLRRLEQRRTGDADGGWTPSLSNSPGDDQLAQQLQMERDKNRHLLDQLDMIIHSPSHMDDASLEDRLKKIDEREQQLHQAMGDKLSKRISSVDDRFFNVKAEDVCVDVQSWVHECYTSAEGRRYPLKCRVFANMFKDCVREYREKMLAQNA